MEDILQLIINNGMGIAVAAYFLMKDWKQSEKRIEADEARAQSDAAQTEVLRELTQTVTSLKEIVVKLKEEN